MVNNWKCKIDRINIVTNFCQFTEWWFFLLLRQKITLKLYWKFWNTLKKKFTNLTKLILKVNIIFIINMIISSIDYWLETRNIHFACCSIYQNDTIKIGKQSKIFFHFISKPSQYCNQSKSSFYHPVYTQWIQKLVSLHHKLSRSGMSHWWRCSGGSCSGCGSSCR